LIEELDVLVVLRIEWIDIGIRLPTDIDASGGVSPAEDL
jgi:hypothetical protein